MRRLLFSAAFLALVAVPALAAFPFPVMRNVLAVGGGGLPSGVTLTAIDGETLTGLTNTHTYFSGVNSIGQAFHANSAWLNNQFIVGEWTTQPQNLTDLGYDVAMGINLLVNPSGGSADYNVIRAGGLHVIAPTTTANTGTETVGWHGIDEPDLTLGDGSGTWSLTGSCLTATACGYTAAKYMYTGAATGGSGTIPYPIDNRVVWIGDGKGVLQFESGVGGGGFTRAATFLKYSDVNAADVYWFVDHGNMGNFWGACQVFWDNPSAAACNNGGGPGLVTNTAILAANYQANVTILRHVQQVNGLGLNGSTSKPIFSYVEVGCPFGENLCVSRAQFVAAAWHTIIAGARGVVWFQHNFGGPCVDYRTLYDGMNPGVGLHTCVITANTGGSAPSNTDVHTIADISAAVVSVDAKINALSAVLLSPTANGYVSATGIVSVMAKYYASTGKFTVFAGSGKPGVDPGVNQTITFTIAGAPSGIVTVLNESRTLTMTSGSFSDTFADSNSVHIYQMP